MLLTSLLELVLSHCASIDHLLRQDFKHCFAGGAYICKNKTTAPWVQMVCYGHNVGVCLGSSPFKINAAFNAMTVMLNFKQYVSRINE